MLQSYWLSYSYTNSERLGELEQAKETICERSAKERN